MENLNAFFGMSQESENIFLLAVLGICAVVALFTYYVNHAPLPGDEKKKP